MTKVLDYSAFVAELDLSACEGCGELGTWAEDGLCPGCHEDARELELNDIQTSISREVRRNREATLRAAGVPERLAHTPFEDLEVWPADQRRPDFPLSDWRGDPWSVLLTGLTGTGKSMAAVEILWRALQGGRRGVFVRAGKVPRIYFSNGGRAAERLELAEVLVLDDVGRGHLGKAWEAIGELVAARYDAELPTLLTSNLTLKDIALHDAHVADRLYEGLLISMDGDSRRQFGRT